MGRKMNRLERFCFLHISTACNHPFQTWKLDSHSNCVSTKQMNPNREMLFRVYIDFQNTEKWVYLQLQLFENIIMRMKRMHELPAHHQLNSQFVRNVFNASCTYHFIILLLCSIMLILSLSRPTIPEVHENRLQFYDRREIVAFTVTYVSHNHTITISKNTTKVCHLLKSTNNIVRSCLC